MSLLHLSKLETQAAELIKSLAKRCDSILGSFSSAPYDSAWVSMIRNDGDDGHKQWRFLECFEYILNNQATDGGWHSGPFSSRVDMILNTMASLLALRVHSREPLNSNIPSDMKTRIEKAVDFLQTQFELWDVEASDRVGFEILVPSLLHQLDREGFHFKLRDQVRLDELNTKKMKKFHPEMLYTDQKSALLHSLEGFIGKIDFDKVGHHTNSGSMMASPAATAVYLMYSTKWDKSSEKYLETVIASGSGYGTGGVPSAFPTPIFELSWTLSTLLTSGFTPEKLGLENLEVISEFLKNSFETGNGLLGFGPNILADADDTAKTIMSLGLISQDLSPERLITEFEITSHFRTYSTERNPSFSTNCNVLCALLYMKDPSIYMPQYNIKGDIISMQFLVGRFLQGQMGEFFIPLTKLPIANLIQNISSQYPMMLLAQVLVRLLCLWDNGSLKEFPEENQSQIPIILSQILNQTLRNQGSDGSSSQSREISAYSVLTIIYLRALPWTSSLAAKINDAIAAGRTFIEATSQAQPDNIWIEKVSYGSEVLCQVYCLSALNATVDNTPWGTLVNSLASIPEKSVNGFVKFFSTLPIFANESKWKLRSSLIEGYLFLPLLKEISHDIFPRKEGTEEKYLEYIPLTWTMTNNLHGNQLSAKFLKDMMVISMLNFQVDEFMEVAIGKGFDSDLAPIKAIVHSLCQPSAGRINGVANGNRKTPRIYTNGHKPEFDLEGKYLPDYRKGTKSFEAAQITLQSFIHYILNHPNVVEASANDQVILRRELEIFLLSHITHIEDNIRFSCQEYSELTAPFLSPRSTYYNWVHTTSANHTSCPYSFAFISCLMSEGSSDCFNDVVSKYLAQDLCCHLAVMCRQYNDYGSIQRDRIEKNLNSINFPEFHSKQALSYSDHAAVLKATLFEVAEFERGCLMSTMGKLLCRVPSRVADMLRLFVGVTDLYGQIYIARDIGIANKAG